MYIYTQITYPPFDIGACNIECVHDDGYARAMPIPYTDEELENLDTEKKIGVLYIEVR